jgi:DNA replication protein DnaC
MPTSARVCECGKTITSHLYPLCDKCLGIVEYKSSIETILASKGVPVRYKGCRFDNYDCGQPTTNKDFSEISRIVASLKKIDMNLKESVFLGSKNNGVGKSHLAVAIMANLVEKGFSDLWFVSSPWIFLDIKTSFDKGEGAEKAIIDRYTNYKFLVIDDIGVEKVSEWSMQIWYMIIDKRHTSMLPTIYTSNMSIQNFAEIDTRIASRLGSGYVYTVPGTDYRIKKFKS